MQMNKSFHVFFAMLASILKIKFAGVIDLDITLINDVVLDVPARGDGDTRPLHVHFEPHGRVNHKRQ